jgi:hypothetical protein
MKTDLIDKTDLAKILKDIFASLGDSIEERARYEGTGRDESAAMHNIAEVIRNSEPDWHVRDVIERHAKSVTEKEIDLSDHTVGKTE